MRCVRVDRIEAFRQVSALMLRNELRDGIGEEFTARNAKAMRERLRRFEEGVRKRDSSLHAASITKVIPLCKSAERQQQAELDDGRTRPPLQQRTARAVSLGWDGGRC